MRLSELFGRTLREEPADADTPSHRLLLRAGLIHQLAAGVYTLLPLGLRVQRKLEQIIRDELAAAGAQELLMPALQPLELWQQSGRDAALGHTLFRLKDRRERGLALGPTHEEVVTQLSTSFIRSYRDLPVTLFQIQTKFRDEARPRAGLLRGREFLMMDAYSFDADEAAVDASYEAMYGAYRRIFARCGLAIVAVQADSGAIGGKESVEFVLPVESGEDVIVQCTNVGCGYAANTEKAEFRRDLPADSVVTPPASRPESSSPDSARDPYPSSPGQAPHPGEPAAHELQHELQIEEVSTPGVKTIDELAAYLEIAPWQTLKAVFYTAVTGGRAELVIVAIRGDIDVNEVKLKNVLACDELRLASDQEVAAAGLVPGSASPVGLSGGWRIVADLSVPGQPSAVAGGNRVDVHLRNVKYGRDFTATMVADIGTAREGDRCARCGSRLATARAIELGHVFKLGVRYSESFRASYLNAEGQQGPLWMGCYGIGVGRTLAAVVEAAHDARGIIWPPRLAPYHVHLVALNVDNAAVSDAAGRLYDELRAHQVEVLFDDRPESAGVKFNDADLLGLPLRATLGPRGVRQGELELKLRRSDAPETLPLAGVAATIQARVVDFLAPVA